MNRKITKTMAKEAASIMANKAYEEKLENAKAKVNAAVEGLVRKYIPAPVIACINEYSSYFSYTKGASITTVVEKKGCIRSATPIGGELSFGIPPYADNIKVVKEEYDMLLKLEQKRRQLKQERDEFEDQVYNALVALRTEKAVEKELPEAMKYLVFPEVKVLPSPIFTGLRKIIASIPSSYEQKPKNCSEQPF